MLGVMVFFLSLASFWPLWVAEAKVLPDGCPDLSGTYFCDDWNIYRSKQFGYFQSFERIPDPDPARNITIYRVFKYKAGKWEESKKKGAIFVADEKKWRGEDHSLVKCKEGVLNIYIEQGIRKKRASWYFKGDILVKKVYETYYDDDPISDRTYPCKRTDDPEAAACNNHWCSWQMDQEKAACYEKLCKHSSENREICFNEKCRNDWSKPTTPRSTVDLVN